MKYLLDTNLISELSKLKPDRKVENKCRQYRQELATAAPVWHELRYGCQRLPHSRKWELLKLFLEEVVSKQLPILPYDEQAAHWHARERARLSLTGQTLSFVDGQIAAIAVTNGLTLVTRNMNDFRSFSGLLLENWHTA
jgi:tRNA(fMet)-specific endonuclease VapC